MSSRRIPNRPGKYGTGVAGDERRPVAGHQIGILVLFDPDSVSGPVNEVLPVTGVVDDPPGHGVDLLGRHPRTDRRHRRLLSGQEHGVAVAHGPVRLPRHHGAGDVRAVADVGPVVVFASEVTDDDFTGSDHTRPGVVMGTGTVGSATHDGEVHPPVASGQQPAADVLGHLRFGPPHQSDGARLELGRHPVGRPGRGPQFVDLVGILHRS
jgi:hypothetical protein